MEINKSWLYLLLFFVFSASSHTYSKKVSDIWLFSKISDSDLFGRHDAGMINDINNLYKQVEIKTDDKFLTITNSFFEDKNVCSIEYVKKSKTPISYFHSQNTVFMYEEKFSHEKIIFPENISVLYSLYPEKECPSPYTELIEINNYLVFIEQGYVLFFKNSKHDLDSSDRVKFFKDDFSEYCQSSNQKDVFDGTFEYKCEFKDSDLLEAYEKVRLFSKNSNVLKEKLPQHNIEYGTHDGKVSYTIAKEGMKITILQGAESWVYSFKRNQSGTDVMVTVDTGY